MRIAFAAVALGLLATAGMVYGETGSPGSLDWVETKDFSEASNDIAFGVATDAQGGVIVVGGARHAELINGVPGVSDDRFTVARYNANGTLDTTFGFGGFVEVDFEVEAFGDDPVRPANAVDVAIDGDGRIVVVGAVYDVITRTVTSGKGKNKTTETTYGYGDSRIAVVRLLPTGAYDLDFSGDGRDVQAIPGATRAIARSVAVLSNGDVIVAGGADFESTSSQKKKKGRGTGTQTTGGAVLLRYEASGILDVTFGGGDGIVTDDYSSGDDEITIDGMGVQPTWNRIVTLDYSNVVRAYDLTTGSPVSTFGTNGTYAPPADDTLDRLLVDTEGDESILLCGSRLVGGLRDGLVTRLSTTGVNQWTTTIRVADNCWIRGLRVDGQGRVVGAAGAHDVMTGSDSRDVFVVRLYADGEVELLGERTTPLDPDTWEFAYDLALTGDAIVLVGDIHDFVSLSQDWFLAGFSAN